MFTLRNKWYVVLILVLGICFFYRSESFGAVDSTKIISDLNKLKAAGYITGIPSLNINEIKSLLTSKSHYGIVITGNSGLSNYRNKIIIFACNGNITNYTNDSNNDFYNTWRADSGSLRGNVYTFSGGSSSTGGLELNGVSIVYAYSEVGISTRSLQLGAGQEYGDNILTQHFEFVPEYDNKVNSNGYYGLNQQNIDYSVTSWKLGNITSWYEDYHQYNFSFIDYNGVEVGYLYYNNATNEARYNNMSLNTFNDSLSIGSAILKYNRVYTLSIYIYDSNNDLKDSYVTTFLFLPYGSIVSGDSILYIGSGDYNIQNQTQFITDAFLNSSVLSGEVSSNFGEAVGQLGNLSGLLSNDFNFSGDLIINMIYSISDILSSSGDVALDIDFRDYHTTLHSSDYYTPEGPFKTFVSISLIAGFVVLLFQQILSYGYKLANLDIKGFLKSSDIDLSYWM